MIEFIWIYSILVGSVSGNVAKLLCEYSRSEYEYKYKYWAVKYEYKYEYIASKYKYKYLKFVLEYYSSTSTSTSTKYSLVRLSFSDNLLDCLTYSQYCDL